MTRPRGHPLGFDAATHALSDWERRRAIGWAEDHDEHDYDEPEEDA